MYEKFNNHYDAREVSLKREQENLKGTFSFSLFDLRNVRKSRAVLAFACLDSYQCTTNDLFFFFRG